MNRDYTTTAQRWSALQQRDPLADGRFVYSVATTGIYCRPVCPSKLALRENVAFHDTPAAAESAGFRPCKRCLPDGPTQSERHTAAVAKACRLIESAESPPSLEELSAVAEMSRYHFHRIFKAVTGVTPGKYSAAHRSQKVRESLLKTPSVTAAIYSAGFNSSSRFYENAAETLGMSPAEYRRGGQGVVIRHAITPCPLGLVLVAGTARGICRVSFGYERDLLEREVRDAFSNAIFEKPDKPFTAWVKNLVAHLKRPSENLDLPLDIRCTAFQQRVWQALREIPPGETASYSEVAAKIGQPTAARAVARACATNPIAVVIPCHRVVGNQGALTGYRWGVERKQQLLQQEGAILK
ncbi:MAG: bifunctional DNA-binding transcriptional regulator/O6-methylguanine-DNA methyltransferase Ada [Luteolibacter sp.]